TPEVHQAIESLAGILSLRTGTEVTAEEAIFEAVKWKVEEELQKDGQDGKERKLPSSYRLVIYFCPNCRQTAAATPDGPVEIPVERARELVEGAEVLDLRLDQLGTCGEPVRASLSSETLLAPRSLHQRPEGPSSLEEASDPAPETGPESRNGTSSHEALPAASEDPSGAREVSGTRDRREPVRASLSSETLLDSGSLVEHAPNLSTPDQPVVSPEERDPPTPPWLRKRTLSRDGYFCRVPGCSNLAETEHHIQHRSRGGPTDFHQLAGVCNPCHNDTVHRWHLLMSGTAEDLILSLGDRRPLLERPGVDPVRLEVEPGPVLPGSPALREDIPGEITPAWWRSHSHRFEWSERRRVLLFHPEREEGAGLAALGP
ncbi:MAG: HNH endonuclease signature motif containing protein, partial [Candidatus Methylomirabilales bacterium]